MSLSSNTISAFLVADYRHSTLDALRSSDALRDEPPGLPFTSLCDAAEMDAAVSRDRLNILGFGQLQANWDGEDAMPISPGVAQRAAHLLSKLWKDYHHMVYDYEPGYNGEISVVIKHGKRDVEFLFYPDRTRILCFEGAKPQPVNAKIGDLPGLLGWLRQSND